MPVQKCPLCLETKNVVVSHLMPAAMYDYCRPPGGHTLSVSSDLVIESDRQLQGYLLCNEYFTDTMSFVINTLASKSTLKSFPLNTLGLKCGVGY